MASAPSRSRQRAVLVPHPGIIARETMTGSSTVPAAQDQMELLLAALDRRDLKGALPAARSATQARAWPGGTTRRGQVTRRCCMARATASVRLVTPSLARMLLTCAFAVEGLT